VRCGKIRIPFRFYAGVFNHHIRRTEIFDIMTAERKAHIRILPQLCNGGGKLFLGFHIGYDNLFCTVFRKKTCGSKSSTV